MVEGSYFGLRFASACIAAGYAMKEFTEAVKPYEEMKKENKPFKDFGIKKRHFKKMVK